MANYRSIENLFLPEVLPEPGLLLANMEDEFFAAEGVVADMEGVGQGFATGDGSISAIGGLQGSGNGAASGSGTLSVAPAPLSWTAKPNVPMSSANVGGYWEYLPAGWNTGPKPVIICFHGSGERGDGITNLNLVLNQGLPNLINNRFGQGNAFPYDSIVIAPQYAGATLPSGRVQDIINFVKNNYDVDLSRIYLTGLSLGAEAITNWWFNGTLTDVAACLIISTPSQFYQPAADNAVAANLPTFWVHGRDDSNSFTPYTKSERWVEGYETNGWPGLNGLGIQPAAILKLLDGVDHNQDAWNNAHDWEPKFVNSVQVNDYGGGLIMDWLLDQQRAGADEMRSTAAGSASGTGQMSGNGSMQGQGNGQASGTGNMTPSMQGQANGQANASGQLSGNGSVQGGGQGQAGGSGQISGNSQIQGQANGQAGGSGQLSANGQMQGQGNGDSDGVGSMDAGAIAGQSNGQANASGQLQGPAAMQGSGQGQGQGVGQVSGDASLAGSASGQATVEGVAYADGLMNGQSGGSSSAIGTISESGVMEITDLADDSRVETQVTMKTAIEQIVLL
jgi:hypothetical protein